MTTKYLPKEWMFPVEERAVKVTVMRGGVPFDQVLPGKKALVATDNEHILGIVGANYRIFTNEEAVEMGLKFCTDAFPDTKMAEWAYADANGPGTRSWAALDIRHQAHQMNLWDNAGGVSDTYTPFVRVTNSYNGTRAVRFDVGFLRRHCSNGVIFEEEAAQIHVPHTRAGIRSIMVARPFEGMKALAEKFGRTLAAVRNVPMDTSQGLLLVRRVIGWPKLRDDASATDIEEQDKLDADLANRMNRYLGEIGPNAYATFNMMTDIASRPPESHRFRRDRPTLERAAGAWLRDFSKAATEPGFTLAAYFEQLEIPTRSEVPKRTN